MLYRYLTATRPDYDLETWEEYDCLFRGGDRLLRNNAVMKRVLPTHGAEDESIYQERIKRACYLPYAGNALQFIVASVFAEPVTMAADPPAPSFYAEEFCHKIDGHKLTLNRLLKQQLLTALVKGEAFTLVDLPPLDSGAVVESEMDEEDVGLLRAFAFPIDPECVLDYDCSPSGDLDWILIRTRYQQRKSLEGDRKTITDRYTYYTRTDWTRWDVTYNEKKPPKPSDDIPIAESGPHSFGRVPVARLELPEGMWAMELLAPLCRALLNKRSGADWAMLRHNFPILTAFLGPEMGPGGEIPSAVAQDPDRATNQVYGIGRILKFGDKDKLEYKSPDPAIFATALQDLSELRDELYRVINQLALAADNSAAALKRSGDSKAQDKAAAAVILEALAFVAREHAVEIHELAAAGRRDEPMAWTAHGAEDFSTEDLSKAIEEAAVVQTLQIPSATLHRIHRYSLAKKIVRGQATPEQLEEIREEIDAGTTPESVSPPDPSLAEPDGDDGLDVPPSSEKAKAEAVA